MDDKRVYLFDTTLRDGAQTQGVDFNPADKELIAKELDSIGIDYIEGGWPGANPTDDAFFKNPPELKRSCLTAFGMTRRAGRSADNDPGLTALLSAGAKAVCMVGKAWNFHIKVVLDIEPEENIAMIRESVTLAAVKADEVIFDAEHFFDGYKANPDFALDCLKAAHEAGARWIVLCDTNGGTLPHEAKDIIAKVIEHIPGDRLGIHAHDDTGNAVAISLAAVRTGVRHVQGSLNGLGERCGNANLITVIPSLVLKMGYETGVTEKDMSKLTHLSRLLDERLNRAPNRGAPYVGESAFAHKGGMHVNAVQKVAHSFEHINPEAVGNKSRILVSDLAGRSNIVMKAQEMGIRIDNDTPEIKDILAKVKEQEHLGYDYEGAEGSLELLIRKAPREMFSILTFGDIPRASKSWPTLCVFG